LAHIAAPDDLVLRAILVKLFNDRQLTVEPHVIGTLALHMDRSFEAAQRLVERCDRLALERQRRVTRAVVTEALAAEGGATKDFDPHE
jgi:chromosomal replication initiation ATPase DnaA